MKNDKKFFEYLNNFCQKSAKDKVIKILITNPLTKILKKYEIKANIFLEIAEICHFKILKNIALHL